jgi:hypothetical protein
MSADEAAEITALILNWDNAPLEEKRAAKTAINDKFRVFIPDASVDEIEEAIRFFRNRHVKAARDRQRKDDTPKVQPEK